MSNWGYISSEDEHPIIIVGPFASLKEAKTAANGRPIIAIEPPRVSHSRCQSCGTFHERLPMDEAATQVYDALFKMPHPVLEWNEDDDCGMAALMREVATVAAQAATQEPRP